MVMHNIHLITGCMFAGKTTELIKELKVAEREGYSIHAFKPEIDKRYSEFEIMTHNNEGIPAIVLNSENIKELLECNADVIGIDEIHLFSSDLIEACKQLAKEKRLIIAGLDKDFQGKCFDNAQRIRKLANKITILYPSCKVCGKKATLTKRLVPNKSRILVGGAEIYNPRCKDCFKL